MKRILFLSVFCVFLLYPSGLFAEDPSPKELDEYLAKADDSYRWEILETKKSGEKTAYLLKLVSQNWHGISWEHYLYLVEPSKSRNPDSCFLFITGGIIGRAPREGDRNIAELIAESAGITVAILFQVPNQPLLGPYVEDALIGETLLKALESNDATWPLLFPMVKSAIRAMDAVQEVLKEQSDREIKKFVVSGASKRGWTTWLTAASRDERVVAIAPIVIDTLNIQKQMQYQLESWGQFSPSIHDYTDRNLVQDHSEELPEFKKRLWLMMDPYSYRTRLELPKLLIHATNDPYWTVDATRHYWDDLPGVKYVLNLPNVGHDLGHETPRAVQTLGAFTRNACDGKPWPQLAWKRTETEDHFTIAVKSDTAIESAKLWSAKSESKDFRRANWKFSNIPESDIVEGKDFSVSISKPDSGHIAYFVEVQWKWEDIPCSITTQLWRD